MCIQTVVPSYVRRKRPHAYANINKYNLTVGMVKLKRENYALIANMVHTIHMKRLCDKALESLFESPYRSLNFGQKMTLLVGGYTPLYCDERKIEREAGVVGKRESAKRMRGSEGKVGECSKQNIGAP